MNKKVKMMTHGAVLAALYVVLTYLQNLIFPDSTSMAIQFRAAEALCVLSLFTPAAVWGLTIGCMVFNLTNAGALPTDVLVGSLATLLATGGMYMTRNWSVKGYPIVAMLLPALFNALLVGWELAVYIGGGFWFNAVCVAIGELAVLLTLGTVLFYGIRSRNLQKRIFS